MTNRMVHSAVVAIAVLVLAACSGAGATTVPSAVAPGDQVSTDDPILVDPMPEGIGELTIPRPGQLDVHPVAADSIEAAVDGRRVIVRISWTSGIEPCYVLDSVAVDRADTSIATTVREGHAPGDNVCIEIAKAKFALVDLGELEPGTYTISDGAGGAAPIEVVVG